MTDNSRFKLSNPIHFLALGFGTGLLKPAPGTWGTLAAIPLFYLIAIAFPLGLYAYLCLVLVGFVVGVFLCGKTARDVGEHDHSAIVWDEIIGYLTTMIAITPTMTNIILGFVLFRVFDIWKPWPISVLDKHVHGGFGIMIDDVLAGVFALICLHLLQIPLS